FFLMRLIIGSKKSSCFGVKTSNQIFKYFD
ncbi:uncharacterized protein METZ01_LOCUS360306, partial [marine metagenome]